MGLLELLRKRAAESNELTVIFLGLENSGKTSVLSKLSETRISTAPTQGYSIKTIKHDDTKISVIDISGHPSFRPYWSKFYARVNAIVYVVDGADATNIEDTGLLITTVLQEPSLSKVPFLLLVNKQDVPGAMTPRAVFDILNISIRRRFHLVQGCSAKTGEGLKSGFSWLTSNAMSRHKYLR